MTSPMSHGPWNDETLENTHIPMPIDKGSNGPITDGTEDKVVCMADGREDCEILEAWYERQFQEVCPYFRHIEYGEPFAPCKSGCWEEPRCLI